MCDPQMSIINVCDDEAYEFNRIIEVFRNSGIRPRRPVISVPLFVVWVATRVAGPSYAANKAGFILVMINWLLIWCLIMGG